MHDRRTVLSALAFAGVSLSPGSRAMALSSWNPPLVDCPAGRLRGARQGDITVYTGIPFGTSTGGANRFRPAGPAPAWQGVFDATRTPAIAPQAPNMLFPVLPGAPSEDCLQLSVWSPVKQGPHPVLVWIHGGGNIQGSCAEPLFDCSVFARDGIVAVAINYRLGTLGFLETGGLLGPSYRGSANNAMLDQILALRWVQTNIRAFGGDPTRITVAGESAGALDLCSLLSAPASRGLAARAIVASGGEYVNEPDKADAFAAHYAQVLGGADRLLSASMEEIVAAQGKAAASWPQAQPFRGVLNPLTLPQRPVAAFSAGSAKNVDLLIGWCRDETTLMAPEAVASNSAFTIPTVAATRAQSDAAMAVYAMADPSLSRAELVWKSSTAEAFGMTSTRIADAQAAAGGRVYKYRLDYNLESGPFKNKTAHGFDVPLVFEKLDHPLAKLYGFSDAELPMMETLHTVWSSFIRTGKPSADTSSWPAYERSDEMTMILDRTSHVEQHTDELDRRAWAGAL